ncbi:MAG: hypothetical protein ABJH98_07055 [Reichenbachiella sp.]|uniref:hypothetical protein n=1 Tax=Reichenbachiella sp. TaxID=2184521 RepID=UPI003297D57E
MASIVFWFFGVVKGSWFDGDETVLLLDSISFGIALFLWIGIWQGYDYDKIAHVFCLTWFPMFVCYWKYLGGIDGSATYIFFTVLMIYLGLLQGKSRLFMTVLLCLINMMLTLDSGSEILLSIGSQENQINPLSINYLLNSVIVASIVVFIKVKFEKEREKIEIRNLNLDRVNQELSIKNEMLSNQQLQIKNIQNNLEELVHERTLELEDRNKELESYAYDNAHLVRRPLSNILSLLEILKEEDKKGMSETQLKNIGKHAKDLDQIVQKINMILH